MLLTPTSNYSSPINQSHQEITKFPQKKDESKGCKMKINNNVWQIILPVSLLLWQVRRFGLEGNMARLFEGLVGQVTWSDCCMAWIGWSHGQTVWWLCLAGHMARLFDGYVWQVTWPDCLMVWFGRSHGQTVWWLGLAGHMAKLLMVWFGQVTWSDCLMVFFGWSHGQTAWWFGLAGLTVNPT